jgi:signal peptidase
MTMSKERGIGHYLTIRGNAMQRLRWPRLAASVALGAFLLLFLGTLLATTAPALGGYHMITITSGSMGDSLPVGSVAVTQTVDADSVRVGDVIAFQQSSGSATVLHRVVSIESIDGQRVAITQGDRNASPDPLPNPLLGGGDRVVYYVPWIGYLFVFAGSTTGLILAIAMLVGLICVPMLRRRRRSQQHHEEGGVAVP